MENKRIAVMPLMAIIAFSILGFAYATWSDYVQIETTVNMGTLTIAFDPDEILDYVDNEPLLPVPKDIGWGEIYYDPASYIEDPHTLKDGYETLIFKVHDAYPCYEIHFTTVRIGNIGLIPAHIVDIEVWDPTGELNWEWTVPPPATPAEGFFWKDFDGDGIYDPGDEEIINVDIVNFVCVQIDPCESIKGEVDLHFKEPAEECHEYHFKIQIKAVQWNKA